MFRLVEVAAAVAGVILAVVAVGALVLVVVAVLVPVAIVVAIVNGVEEVRYYRSVEGLRARTREALSEEERRYFDSSMKELAQGVDALREPEEDEELPGDARRRKTDAIERLKIEGVGDEEEEAPEEESEELPDERV